MIQPVIWLLAFTISLVGGACLVTQFVLLRRWYPAVWSACFALAVSYCLLGADAAGYLVVRNGDMLFVGRFGLLVLTALVVIFQLLAVRWFVQERSTRL